jgi:uncharacterized protein
MSLIFEWDPGKERLNLENHDLSFRDAMPVFDDPLARIFADEWHSVGERREIAVGHHSDGRLLLVVFRELPDGRIRIISARRATPREQRDYERNT